MADITFGYTPAPGGVTSPTGVGQNLYKPATAGSSFAEVNGLIEKANTDSATYKVRSGLIRDRSMGNGVMSGSTMTADYMASLNPVNEDESGAFVPIAGASRSFFLPVAPSALWLTWQVITATDNGSALGSDVTLKLRVDGTVQANQIRRSPASVYKFVGTRYLRRDRIWSGSWHAKSGGITAGWHTATILYWASKYAIDNADHRNHGGMTRFRVRNMKVFWLA